MIIISHIGFKGHNKAAAENRASRIATAVQIRIIVQQETQDYFLVLVFFPLCCGFAAA